MESGTFGNNSFIKYAETHVVCACAFIGTKHGTETVRDRKTGQKVERCKLFPNLVCETHVNTQLEVRALYAAGRFDMQPCPSTYLLDGDLNTLWVRKQCFPAKDLKEAIEDVQEELGPGLVGAAYERFVEAEGSFDAALGKGDFKTAVAEMEAMREAAAPVQTMADYVREKQGALDQAALAAIAELARALRGEDDKAARRAERELGKLERVFSADTDPGAAVRAALGDG